MLDRDDTTRLYGPWRHRTPRDAAEMLRDYSGRWWIAGEWAINAFVDVPRDHGDLNVGIPREEPEGFVEFVSSTLDVWAAAGSLTPLRASGGSGISDECGNLWLRASGAEPPFSRGSPGTIVEQRR